MRLLQRAALLDEFGGEGSLRRMNCPLEPGSAYSDEIRIGEGSRHLMNFTRRQVVDAVAQLV